MSGRIILPKGGSYWPRKSTELTPEKVQKLYESGFVGAWQEPEAEEEFAEFCQELNGTASGADIAHANGWAGSAAGQLVIPFLAIEKHFPGSMPGPAQERGDCVSHSGKNGILVTLACEIAAGKPDEVTGLLEGIPDLPEEGIRQGVISSEYQYWWRGYNGDGWSCPTQAQVALKRGVLLKKPYPDLDIDLTKYSGRLAGKYGRQSPPDEIAAKGAEHLVRSATPVNSFEEVRDFLANGYGISSCGSEGWSSSRDENGFSRRQGSWAHAMAYIGADDRRETHDEYGEGLVLILNSWGKSWNRGGRKILGTSQDIPEGSFWAKWSDCRRRYAVAFSSLNGWPSRTPDYVFI